MLRFFRSNQIFVAVILLVYLILIRLGALVGWVNPPAIPDSGGLFYQTWFGWMKAFPVISALTALLLVFIQAFAVNFLADEFRLLGDRNWFPGLLYGLTASAFPEYLFVSAPLVGATFLPGALWKIFRSFQKPNVQASILDSALWISTGSLFYPPLAWILVAGFAGLLVVRVFRFSEILIYTFGAIIPLFLGWLWFFWADQGSAFRDLQWSHLFNFSLTLQEWRVDTWMKFGMLGVFTLLFLLALPSALNRKGIQIQKFVSVLVWFLIVGILTTFLQPTWSFVNWIVPVTPAAVLLALGLQDYFKKWWIEPAHLMLLLFLFMIQYATWVTPLFQYL